MIVRLFVVVWMVGAAAAPGAQGSTGAGQERLRNYPPAGDHQTVSIADLRADTLPPGTYTVVAIVHSGRRCPQCPPGVSCPRCAYDEGIMVNEMADAATNLVFIAAEPSTQLHVGIWYRLAVLVSNPRVTPYPGRRVLVGLEQWRP